MAETNPNARLEAFCDAVFAIALTLLIIDIKVPSMEVIGSTSDLWHALQGLAPSVFAFLLSFAIILITWVNHHGTLKLVRRSTASFVYANGFLLLTVVFIPFPTSLLGEFLGTGHAAPAVVLYDGVLAVQAIGWILLLGTVLKNRLVDDDGAATLKENKRNGYFAFGLYSVLALAAFWFPVWVAVITTVSWIFWLSLGIALKHS